MFRKKIILYFKVFLVTALAFGTSGLLIQDVFIAGSPQIRQGLGNYLALKYNPMSIIQGGPSVEDQLQDLPMQEIAKGVYAKDDGVNDYTLVKLDEVDLKEYRITIRGKEVVIRVPVGQEPPSQEALEQIYK